MIKYFYTILYKSVFIINIYLKFYTFFYFVYVLYHILKTIVLLFTDNSIIDNDNASLNNQTAQLSKCILYVFYLSYIISTLYGFYTYKNIEINSTDTINKYRLRNK